jgi:hypothetical protein
LGDAFIVEKLLELAYSGVRSRENRPVNFGEEGITERVVKEYKAAMPTAGIRSESVVQGANGCPQWAGVDRREDKREEQHARGSGGATTESWTDSLHDDLHMVTA